MGLSNKLMINLHCIRKRTYIWMLTDMIIINISVFFALLIRFDFNIGTIPWFFLRNYLLYIGFLSFTTLILFRLFKLHTHLWSFVSVRDACVILAACTVLSAAHIIGTVLTGLILPQSVYLISYMLFLFFMLLIRFLPRVIQMCNNSLKDFHTEKSEYNNIMIIGAGAAGNMLIREIKSSKFIHNNRVSCVIDDDKDKIGMYIHGVFIAGGRDYIKNAVKIYGIGEIIFAIPSAEAKDKKDILEICSLTGCKTKVLPGVYQLIDGQVSLSNLRNVEIDDLLGREPVNISIGKVSGLVEGSTVLITGAGGSIGSELCRQIADCRPHHLILLDLSENSLYDLQQEMCITNPKQKFSFLIASVRDENRINAIFEKYRPDLVYHAAAHKHVPLMEDSPNEAIKNNVFGTLTTVKAAIRWKTKKFVLISSDKAVNPTNIMGATKRISEMIIQAHSENSCTKLSAVRFGNVLNSNGSVIPLFKKQIAAGGPVTVTHPEITRFFMTIPEAVSLVLQAGAFAGGGEIFILDMGEPVKITELAKKLIYLSGYIPDEQIKIKYTGLRPGEKLYEELLMKEEGLTATKNELIYIGCPINFNREDFFNALSHLKDEINNENSDIRDTVKAIVPTYDVKNLQNQLKINQSAVSEKGILLPI